MLEKLEGKHCFAKICMAVLVVWACIAASGFYAINGKVSAMVAAKAADDHPKDSVSNSATHLSTVVNIPFDPDSTQLPFSSLDIPFREHLTIGYLFNSTTIPKSFSAATQEDPESQGDQDDDPAATASPSPEPTSAPAPVASTSTFTPDPRYVGSAPLLSSISLDPAVQQQTFIEVCGSNVKDFCMMMAVAKKESQYHYNVVSAVGLDFGMYQVRASVHRARMAKYGLTNTSDLFNPIKCGYVALDLLHEKMAFFGVAEVNHLVLISYNAGHVNRGQTTSSYSIAVMGYYQQFLAEMGVTATDTSDSNATTSNAPDPSVDTSAPISTDAPVTTPDPAASTEEPYVYYDPALAPTAPGALPGGDTEALIPE